MDDIAHVMQAVQAKIQAFQDSDYCLYDFS